MAIVAFMTIGVLSKDWDNPANQEFVDRIDTTVLAAENTPGFIASDFSPELPWGETIIPSSVDRPEFESRHAVTLSVWQDLESVYAYAYFALHGDALRHRHDWFVKGEWPAYVAWWVPDGTIPTWQEAVQRYDHLHQQGPTPSAFNFKHAFDADGNPIKIDRNRVKEKAAQLPEIDWREYNLSKTKS